MIEIFIFKYWYTHRIDQKWSTSKSNISKKLMVPTHSSQILKEQCYVYILEWVSWSGFSGATKDEGPKLAKFRK